MKKKQIQKQILDTRYRYRDRDRQIASQLDIYIYSQLASQIYIYIYPPTPAICRGSAPEKKCHYQALWLQKAMLGSSLAPAQRHGHLPGAFQQVFKWLQKVTLGTSLALNSSRHPCQRLLQPSGCPAAQRNPWAICRALSKRFSGGFRKRRQALAWL